MGSDLLPLMAWLQERIWPVEDQLTPEDVYWSALLAIGEMLKGGVTTCGDMYFHMEAAARAASEAGHTGQPKPGNSGRRRQRARGLAGGGGVLPRVERRCQWAHHHRFRTSCSLYMFA